jgi:hypothetical protein
MIDSEKLAITLLSLVQTIESGAEPPQAVLSPASVQQRIRETMQRSLPLFCILKFGNVKFRSVSIEYFDVDENSEITLPLGESPSQRRRGR